jgi:NADPH2:quinone reductase
MAESQLQLQSLITKEGKLDVFLAKVPVPELGPDDVLIRIEAAPINPSDLGLLFGPADMKSAKVHESDGELHLTADVPAAALAGVAGRIDTPMPVGNEGAGTVIKAGSSPAAQALLNKQVAVIGGAMYAERRVLPADQCLVLPADASAVDGASSFVNPVTALGMVWTMKAEGHHALVHTAAASNLGQMLVRICQKDKVALVNIVRKPEQVALLKAMGAEYVVDSSSSSFTEDLTAALVATDATIAFDAIGGGGLASQILNCMEQAQLKKTTGYNRYGTPVMKQVYVYGGLDTGPTELRRGFGMSWSIGGWLLFFFFQKIGQEGRAQIKARIAAELKTTFASSYAGELSLRDVLKLDKIAAYGGRETGKKYFINPSKAA